MMWALMTTALAGSLYVNGVVVDAASLSGVKLENVTVNFDASGDILVTAPGYNVEVLAPVDSPTTAKNSVSAVKPGQYWLVTEDSGSLGHTIVITINGHTVQTIRSGDSQVILDVAKWLVRGDNKVHVSSISEAATGGELYIYIGQGGTEGGTVTLNRPDVQYGLSENREGAYSRDFTIKIK